MKAFVLETHFSNVEMISFEAAVPRIMLAVPQKRQNDAFDALRERLACVCSSDVSDQCSMEGLLGMLNLRRPGCQPESETLG